MIKYLLPSRLQPPSHSAGNVSASTTSPYAAAIASACAGAWQHVRAAAWLSVPIGLLGLLPSIFILQVYNRVIARGGNSTLIAMVAGVVCFLCIEWWLRRKRAKALREAGAEIDYKVSQALMASMLQRPLLDLERRPTSQWLQLFRDVAAMRSSISGGLAGALMDLPMVILALVVIGIVAWPVLPVILVAMLILGILAWWWADEVRSGRVEELAQARSLDRHTTEVCNARATLKLLGHDQTVRQTWQNDYDSWLSESFNKNGELENTREASTMLLAFFTIAVITVGAIAINSQWMSIGSLMAVNLLASKALGPIAQLAGNWRSLARANEATQRLQAALQEPVEPASQDLSLPRPTGQMQLKQVSFEYGSGQRTLDSVSLSMGPGGIHAIVGRNGAGKSTLGKLLAGLYAPTEGHVFIDEYDLAQFSRADIGEWIGCLGQQVYWFSGPIIDSLRMVNEEATDAQIVAACQIAGAHPFISRLPQGYQTALGEAGTGISAGELRKLALAQLFLRNPTVLILDEPTSDLDFESETALLQTLHKIAQKHTVIIITHSVRVASLAQRIYHVSGDGHIEQGSATELLPKLFGVTPAHERAPATEHAQVQQVAA